ncbi:transcriptional regulator SinR [Gracilibacillus halophilus YIM-C55.5]|uniref:Transcriptional regulator SinR n=2 Tax=Gracilibacillus TaxID=74385 RepID=N4WAZ3_9BACI|nr:transcriptional regulator SinR [Gracilibacillus halophilus YIM-C55.5]
MMIGENISRIRKQKHFTLSELAERANISKSYLSNIERDLNKNPSIHVIEKLAQVLQVDVMTILGNNREESVTEHEWIRFVQELKTMGIDKETLEDYRPVFEFIRWKNAKNE